MLPPRRRPAREVFRPRRCGPWPGREAAPGGTEETWGAGMEIRRGVLVAVLVAVAAGPRPARAQPAGAVQERAGATVIEIPVNVIGRDGRPVAGLEAADFELYDDGKKQTLNAVELIELSGATPAGQTPEELPASARRLWLLVFDLSYTSSSGLLRARDGARDFVTASMSDRDLAAVGTLSVDTGWKLLVNFTRDRGQLAAAIDTLGLPGLAVRSPDPLGFAFAPPGTSGTNSGALAGGKGIKGGEVAEALREIQGLQRQSDDGQQRGRVTRLMDSLAGIGRVLDSVRGRKHVVYFSEGFETRLLSGRAGGASAGSRETQLQLGSGAGGALDPGTTQGANEAAISGEIWKVDNDARYGNSSLQERLTASLGLFGRSDAVLDAIDIGGLRAEGDAAGPKAGSGTDSLSTMAAETGGDFVRNANALGSELSAVAERTGRVYLLVYQPKALSKPGAFHKLKIEVKASGAKVLARSGYYEPRPYANLSPLERLLASGDLLTGGVPGEGLDGRLVVAPFPSPGAVPQVPVVVELSGASLLAGDKGDRATVQIYAYANDAAGALADYVATEVALDLTKTRESLKASGVKFYGTLYLPPGEYGVRVLARNAATGRAGVFSAPVSVPAIPGGAPTVLPPFFEEPAGRWVMVRAKARADAPEREPDYPFAIGGEAFIPSALPSVPAGSEARVAVFAYNFGGGKTSPLSVTGSAVGADGASRPIAVTVVKASDAERGGGRKLLLAFKPEGLPAGLYRLDIAVSDAATKASGLASSAFRVP